MSKCSNIYIYIYIISASLSMDTATATDNITGLQIGFGLNVSHNNYESDVSVGLTANNQRYTNVKTFGKIDFQSAGSISNEQFTKENATQLINDLINTNTVNGNYAEQDVTFGGTKIVEKCIQNIKELEDVYAEGILGDEITQCYVQQNTSKEEDIKEINKNKYVPLNKLTLLTEKNGTEINIKETEDVYLDITDRNVEKGNKISPNTYTIDGDNASEHETSVTLDKAYITSEYDDEEYFTIRTDAKLQQYILLDDLEMYASEYEYNQKTEDNPMTLRTTDNEAQNIYLKCTLAEIHNVIDLNFYSITEEGSFFRNQEELDLIFLSKRARYSRHSTNTGGELKLAYFHDIGNGIIAGLDLSGNITSKSRQKIDIRPFTINKEVIALYRNNEEDELEKIFSATYNENENKYIVNEIANNASITNGEEYIVHENVGGGFEASNPDVQRIRLPGSTYSYSFDTLYKNNIYVSKQESAEMSFEKGAFNPKLAFVVGKNFGDWFIGGRAGMEYVTGKVKLSTHNPYYEQYTTTSKNVSITSPFVGLHVIKQTKLGSGANLYMTADWNIGDGHKKVDMNGVKSFKHSGYNVSAGVTWKCKIGI